MEGWVSLHRKIVGHWMYQEKRTFSRFEAWVDLILMANHKDTRFPLGNEIIEAKRGEVITSEVKLMERWKWGKSKLRGFLDVLEHDGMIAKKSDRKKTTITIVNYGTYQDSNTTNRLIADHEQTASVPPAYTINNDNNVINAISINPTTPTTGEMNPFKLFEKEGFGTLSEIIGQKLGEFIDTYGERWTCEAMKEAVFYGKRNLPYCKMILETWKTSGIDEPWTQEKKPTNDQSNVKPFQRYGKSQKQSLPLVPISVTGTQRSAEERAAARARAAMLDGKENIR